MFLKSFTLPDDESEYRIAKRRMQQNGGAFGYLENGYPCGIFPDKGIETLEFARLTLLCGGNGSGKSTVLNVIAQKLGLARVSPFNSSELFDAYAEACRYTLAADDEGEMREIPPASRIITSDDVFDYMLAVRDRNEALEDETVRARREYARLKFGETVKLSGMEDYEALRMQLLARRKTRRRFVHAVSGTPVRLFSNGETALEYFDSRLEADALYLLDEPENSMSPMKQIELAALLTELTRYCGCQFIIATHSPFLLATDGAKVYDFDSVPVRETAWYELEHIKTYREFFKRHDSKFE